MALDYVNFASAANVFGYLIPCDMYQVRYSRYFVFCLHVFFTILLRRLFSPPLSRLLSPNSPPRASPTDPPVGQAPRGPSPCLSQEDHAPLQLPGGGCDAILPSVALPQHRHTTPLSRSRSWRWEVFNDNVNFKFKHSRRARACRPWSCQAAIFLRCRARHARRLGTLAAPGDPIGREVERAVSPEGGDCGPGWRHVRRTRRPAAPAPRGR